MLPLLANLKGNILLHCTSAFNAWKFILLGFWFSFNENRGIFCLPCSNKSIIFLPCPLHFLCWNQNSACLAKGKLLPQSDAGKCTSASKCYHGSFSKADVFKWGWSCQAEPTHSSEQNKTPTQKLCASSSKDRAHAELFCSAHTRGLQGLTSYWWKFVCSLKDHFDLLLSAKQRQHSQLV